MSASLCESNSNDTDNGLMVKKSTEVERFDVESVGSSTDGEKKGPFACFEDCFGLCKKKKKDPLLLSK